MPHNGIRALTGLVTIAVIAAIVATAVCLFQGYSPLAMVGIGSFDDSVPVTVIAERAGLVMNRDAKVKMHGVQVGKVDSICFTSPGHKCGLESPPNDQAVLHLAMDRSEVHLIPSDVRVDLTSPTVFGAKFVELVPPAEPSTQSLHAGQVIDGKHIQRITVEVNTVFKNLTSVLNTLDPAKLNETLGAVSQALSGRGEKIGQAFSDLDSFLAKFQPSLPALSNDIAMSAPVFKAYGDGSADLVKTLGNAVTISKSIVDQQHNLDALLISAIGLADVGNDVLTANRKALTTVFHLLAPTTDLLNEYAPALTCTMTGDAVLAKGPVLPEPSIAISASLTFGAERYRYPANLPKVAATGGPHCMGLPNRPFNSAAKVLIADTGSNPVVYGNPQLLLNFDGLKQLLYGPIDGPPRNPVQVGQQG